MKHSYTSFLYNSVYPLLFAKTGLCTNVYECLLNSIRERVLQESHSYIGRLCTNGFRRLVEASFVHIRTPSKLTPRAMAWPPANAVWNLWGGRVGAYI
jgi:hypothetical protein